MNLMMSYQEFAKWIQGNGEQCTAMAKKTGMRCPHKAKATMVFRNRLNHEKGMPMFVCQGHLMHWFACREIKGFYKVNEYSHFITAYISSDGITRWTYGWHGERMNKA